MSRPLINFIKKVQSYFRFIPVETTSSVYSDSLEVVFFEGRFMLNTKNATYSFEDKYSSFRTALQVIQNDLPAVRSVLVLGLGLGSIPQMLQEIHHINIQIDCIEIDATIIKLAEKYYPSKAGFRMLNIHHADAYDWILNNTQKYDLIATDLFIDKHIPYKFHQRVFLEQLKFTLAPGGILLFSRLKEHMHTEQELWDNIKTIFWGGIDIDTGGNLIMKYKADRT